MSQTLTPLELDLFGDLCRDDRQIWEVFDFVRLHHQPVSEQEIFDLGRKFMMGWLQKGWIEIVDAKGKRDKMSAEKLAKFFEKTGISLMTQFDSTVWVEIAEKGEEVFNSSKSPV